MPTKSINEMFSELSPAEELKLVIIENYIEWFTSNDSVRKSMIDNALWYVYEDHCNELQELLSNERRIKK